MRRRGECDEVNSSGVWLVIQQSRGFTYCKEMDGNLAQHHHPPSSSRASFSSSLPGFACLLTRPAHAHEDPHHRSPIHPPRPPAPPPTQVRVLCPLHRSDDAAHAVYVRFASALFLPLPIFSLLFTQPQRNRNATATATQLLPTTPTSPIPQTTQRSVQPTKSKKPSATNYNPLQKNTQSIKP